MLEISGNFKDIFFFNLLQIQYFRNIKKKEDKHKLQQNYIKCNYFTKGYGKNP